MKKIISVMLVIAMIFSMSAMMSFAAEEKTSFIVASDIHYAYDQIENAKKATGNTTLAATVNGAGQLIYESEAILDAFLKEASQDSAKYVILAGDLTDSGSKDAAVAMAAKLREFENSTGKSVFVIPGNHDVNGIGKNEFINIYSAFGYSEVGVQRDSLSASYSIDVDDDYRLLCIDTTAEKSSGFALDEERVEWIEAQCKQAQDDKKHVIAVMHHNLLQHFVFDFMHEGSVIDESLGLKEIFAEYDVKYTFSGHTHAQDIMQYTGENGNVIYEVVNGALNAYPVAYRVVEFSDKEVKFASKSIKEIDTSDFAAMKISEESIKHAKSDIKGYAHLNFKNAIKELFREILCTEKIKELLGIDYENYYDVTLIIDKVGKKLEEILVMPLYTKDKNVNLSVSVQARDAINGQPLYTDDGDPIMVAKYSIQEISESYGGMIPDSHYKDLLDVIVLLYETHVSGSVGIDMSSNEYNIVVHGLAAALNYCLYSISEAEYGILMKFLAGKLEPTLLGKIPSSLYTYVASGKEGFEQNIIFVTYLAAPFLLPALSDEIPSDKNVNLSAYQTFEVVTPDPEPDTDTDATPEEPAKEDTSFKAKLAAFFDKIADFFKMLFRTITFQNI